MTTRNKNQIKKDVTGKLMPVVLPLLSTAKFSSKSNSPSDMAIVFTMAIKGEPKGERCKIKGTRLIIS